MRLTTFHSQFRAIGTNYNQCVRALKSNFSEKKALALSLIHISAHRGQPFRVRLVQVFLYPSLVDLVGAGVAVSYTHLSAE